MSWLSDNTQIMRKEVIFITTFNNCVTFEPYVIYTIFDIFLNRIQDLLLVHNFYGKYKSITVYKRQFVAIEFFLILSCSTLLVNGFKCY